jgi:hypothetical protein
MSNEQIRRDEQPSNTPKQPREHQENVELSDLPATRVEKDENVKGGFQEPTALE